MTARVLKLPARPMAKHRPGPPQQRGYAPLYHVGEEKQRCPCCHGLQWFIGRVSAECAKCGTALPLSTMGAEFGGE